MTFCPLCWMMSPSYISLPYLSYKPVNWPMVSDSTLVIVVVFSRFVMYVIFAVLRVKYRKPLIIIHGLPKLPSQACRAHRTSIALTRCDVIVVSCHCLSTFFELQENNPPLLQRIRLPQYLHFVEKLS